MKEKISLVVPCYNEGEGIEKFYEETMKTINKLIEKYDYEMLFIDDGSADNTLQKLKGLNQKDENVRVISFSRNFGKEAAMYAGLENFTGEYVVIMDADLQNDPEIILQMIKGIEEGYDIVTTCRNRKGESVIRSMFAKMFYGIMGNVGSVKIRQGSQDYRMMKRQVAESILSLKEYNRFSKGIFNWVGYNVKYIEVENRPRVAGESKWNFSKLFKYAIDGITSFTIAPLKISIVLGFIISFLAIILGIAIVIETIAKGKAVPGYASTITAVLFIGGIQLVSIGILSEYISKMYLEIKQRPKYIVKEEIGDNVQKNDLKEKINMG